MPRIEKSRRMVATYEVEDLGAGADITNRRIFAAPAGGCVLEKIGLVGNANPAGIDNSNTSVWAVTDEAENSIVSRTYDAGTAFPNAGVYGDLGALSAAHAVLTANEVVRLSVTNGATADPPLTLLVIEYVPIEA